MFKSRFTVISLVILLLATPNCQFKDPFDESKEERREIKEVSVTEVLDIGGTEVEVIGTHDKKGRLPRDWGINGDKTTGTWVMVRLRANRELDIRQFKLVDWSGKKVYLPHKKSIVGDSLLLFKIPEGEELDWDRHPPKLRFQEKEGKDFGFIIL